MIRSNYSTEPPAVIMGGNINLLTVFGQLVAGGIGVTTDDPDFAKWLRKHKRCKSRGLVVLVASDNHRRDCAGSFTFQKK